MHVPRARSGVRLCPLYESSPQAHLRRQRLAAVPGANRHGPERSGSRLLRSAPPRISLTAPVAARGRGRSAWRVPSIMTGQGPICRQVPPRTEQRPLAAAPRPVRRRGCVRGWRRSRAPAPTATGKAARSLPTHSRDASQRMARHDRCAPGTRGLGARDRASAGFPEKSRPPGATAAMSAIMTSSAPRGSRCSDGPGPLRSPDPRPSSPRPDRPVAQRPSAAVFVNRQR